MPNILRTVHNWSGYTNLATANLQPRMLAKRELDGAGLCTVIVLIIVIAIVFICLMIRCARNLHARQYERSGGKARWSVHHRPERQCGSHHVTRTNRETDLESGVEMPQYPPPSYHSNSTRSAARSAARTAGSHGTRSKRVRPSQTVQQYLRSQARSGNARRGAPSSEEYFNGQ